LLFFLIEEMRRKQLNENTLRQIIRRALCETFQLNETITTSYNNSARLSIALRKLGFHHMVSKEEDDGNWQSDVTNEYIAVDDFTEDVQRKFQSLLNLYNFRIIKKRVGQGENARILFSLESVYGNEACNSDGIWYHATPTNKVDKILRIGLCPKDGGKRGDFRGDRIYLSPRYDTLLFGALGTKDYTVLTIDLSKANHPIRLFEDPQAERCVYTLENIPPQCISVGAQKHKIEEEEKNKFWHDLENIVTERFPQLKLDGHGTFKGILHNKNKNRNSYICINISYKPYARYTYHDIEVTGHKTRFVTAEYQEYGKGNKTYWINGTKGFDNVQQVAKFILRYCESELK
jgi:hypothetical protein